ncbi:MAG: hypothetical protein HKN47_20430 [Pirellulaceae bacterium]|nr:hypothetical protein [Pirellulaceae bacterium]
MPRRPRADDDDISLFPFLSIIASVIGVLTMMIATLALAQTDTPDVAQIEEYEQTKKEMAKAEDRIEELRQEISVSKSAALEIRKDKKALTMTVAELEQLLAELEKIEKELAEQQKVQIVIPEVNPKDRETAADMQRQFDQLKEELAQLEKELNERKDAPTEGNVTVLPQGSGLNFTPHFVEAANGSIVLHNLDEPKRIRQADIVKDKDFLELLNLVANGKDDSIVFLVRSDGLGTYRMCRDLCNGRDIRNGKIPVVGQGRIDLSAFNKRKR